MFHETEFVTRREMPGENRDQLSRGGGGAPGGRRESSRSSGGGGGEPDPPRNRGLTTTMIPLPRTGQFASASQNQKIVKTEKNRLRLIMESRGTAAATAVDVLDKERKIGMEETPQDNWRLSAANCSAVARFAEESGDSHREKENAETRRDRPRATEGRVSCGSSSATAAAAAAAGIGVEGVAGAWGAQRGRQSPPPPPLASRRLDSAADAAAASFNPATQRCAAAKGAAAVDAAAPRPPRTYPGLPLVAETSKEDAMEPEAKEEDERRSSTPSPEFYLRRSKRYNEDGSSEEEAKQDSTSLPSHRLPSSYRGTWPIRRDVWANQQIGFPAQQSTSLAAHNDVASVMSFSSSSNSAGLEGNSVGLQGHRRLGAKVDVVYNLLGMLEKNGRDDMSTTLLSMSTSIDSCLVMRQSGCLPLLVQLIHAPGQNSDTRDRAMQALHNVVHAKSDERAGRREARVLRFLEQLRDYCQNLRISLERGQSADDLERGHPAATIAALMKLSFDEAHRHAMCQLGGLHAVAELIEMDHLAHGSESDDQNCITLRRYAGMALTNLTFGDGNNKALLCSFKEFMKALVSQLRSPSDDLRQVTASVLRNLSWRADSSSKHTLRDVGAVTGLMKAAMEGRKESTLKSILSALWNLSAHCSTNKVDICAVDGALAFLVDMLSYKAPSKTLAIVENAGGILRNVSSHVAVREDYRAIVRERGCLQVLLQQLRSPSLTVVSNACGALWNLSARCPSDQRLLWDLGAVPMLRSLVHSKHKMISMGSSAALKNLLSARPGCNNLVHLDSTARGLGLSTLPSLIARRQRALEQEIDQNLAETCDNIEPSTSPISKDDKFTFKLDHSFLGVNAHGLRPYQLHSQPSTSTAKCNGVARSESRDSMRSVTSTHSDTMFERVNRHVLNGMSPTDSQIKQQSSSLHSAVGFGNNTVCGDGNARATSSERKYTLRYKNAIPEQLRPSDGFDMNELRCTNSTISWAAAPNQEPSQTSLHSSIENNMSLIDQSVSSSSKAGSQSSVSEEVEATVCAKSDYRRATAKAVIDGPKPISYLSDVSPIKESASFGNVYPDTALLRQHDALNSIQKAILPATIVRSPELFGDYAETDLDQPTDYSLRYGEQTIDDEKQHSGFFSGNDQGLLHEDTVRTYYTEGTPHRTSLNSSRATSASDLQDDSRIRGSSKKLPERYKARHVEDHRECKASSLTDVPKLNDFAKSETELNLRDMTHLTDDESANRSLPYFEENLGKHLKGDRGDATIQSHLSVRTTPISMVLGNSEYNDDHDGESSSRINSLDSKPNKRKVNKDLLPSDIELSSGNTGLKTSNNDSGYQVSDGDEDDEDLLAACINIGMQNNRHRHSFIGNNLEKLPRSESNLTRYQTSLALDQVEHNGTVASDSSSFNIKYAEPQGTVSENVLAEKNRKDNNEKLSKKNIQLEIATANVIDNYMRNEKSNNASAMKTINDDNFGNNFSEGAASILQKSDASLDKNVFNDFIVNDECGTDQKGSIRADEAITDDQLADIPSMKQSFTKDSESSESIDSVEQSEHALLELCIQPGIKSEGNIAFSQSNADYVKSQLELYNKQIDFIKGRNSEVMSEIDGNMSGKPEATFEIVRTTDILHRDSAEKHIKEETYRRQRDPDAMIASLDRLTATLVQQTEAIRERDSGTMKQSLTYDTWNEDSPNDVSFPSISISAPLVASFNSDAQEDQRITMSENNEQANMTESKIIQREAIKLAEAVDAEANNQNELETTSLTSIDLEAIKPPSSMGSLLSLTASYAGTADNTEAFIDRDRCYSTSLPPAPAISSNDPRNVRKKSLPIGVVAKRALGQSQSHTSSLENLLNECTSSHLENVKPPSMMDELPDVGDMENSMLSVASIMSEIADSKEQNSHSLTGSDPAVFEMLKPVANVLSMTCMRYVEAMQNSASNSLSDCLENINPPSLFNEVTEMDESTMEANTDTMCSDTLCIDTELHSDEAVRSIVAEVIDEAENDTEEAATPISSEYCVSSSAESTPKRRPHSRTHLTPKQKRNLAKERYKTYTIAAEIVKKEEEERRRQDGTINGAGDRIPRGKSSPFSKVTPKQRRQENRARFQTQVLENPFPDLNMAQTKEAAAHVPAEDAVEKQEAMSTARSSIPTLTKLPVCKALRRKRGNSQENKERYRTRTLNDSETVFKEIERNPVSCTGATEEVQASAQRYAREEIQNMLEQNATIVLNTLNESNKTHDPIGDDILRCETVTLASNDSESDHNLRMRFVNGLSRKLMDTQHANDPRTLTMNINELKAVHAEVAYEDLDTADPIDSGSDEESNCADEEQEPRETKRPRIIKPGMPGRDPSADSNGTDKSEPESPKAIRGRRKALYSNPITRKPTPQSSPLKQANPVSGIPIGRSNTSPIVRATRATTLRQNNNTTTVATKDSPKSNTSPKRTLPSADAEKRTRNLTVVSKRASVPQKGSSLTFTKSTKRHSTPPACSSNYQNDSRSPEVAVKPLERQGTFTKDEPEVENAPTVHSASASPIKTKIAKPIKGASSKVYPAAGKSKISVKAPQIYQSKMTVANSSEKIQSPKGLLMAPKKMPSGKIGAPAKLPNGNAPQNDKTVRRIDPLGQRSNSNSNIVSNSSINVQNRKLAKEATSKIASLWKKVEESKNKQRFEKPDTRQWIRPANSATEVDAAAAVTFNNPPVYKLFRSSTFEGISQEDSSDGEASPYKSKPNRPPVLSTQIGSGGSKYRNSCDLTGMSGHEAPCKIPMKSSETYKRDTTQLGDTLVTMRKQLSADFAAEADPTKRISRLGSFIRVDPTTAEAENSGSGVRTPASAIVPPFNYNPKPDIPSQAAKARSDEGQSKFEAADCHAEIVTGSARVTTV